MADFKFEKMKLDRLMDAIGRKIAAVLEEDARISYSRLGREVGLSTPAVTERVRKMEEAGIITGYHARIVMPEPPTSILAFLDLTVPSALYANVHKTAARLPQVLECHHVSGQTAFILKIRADSISELERVISEFSGMGQTRTRIVLSSA